MRQSLYDQVVSHLTLDRSSVDRALRLFPMIDPQTMLAIYLRRAQNLYKVAHANLSALGHPNDYFYMQFRECVARRADTGADATLVANTICEMGEQVGLPPCLMARFIVRSFLHCCPDATADSVALAHASVDADTSLTLLAEETDEGGPPSASLEGSCNGARSTSASSAASGNPKMLSLRVGQIIKCPDLARPHDADLAACLVRCLEVDMLTSPAMDVYRHQIGAEKEIFLHSRLQERAIIFHSEAAMRAAGYPKTPDALLAYPVEVDGHIVNWIESKALFGDAAAHAMYLRDQYWPYYNRFGPGLVIYWYGFIDELNGDCERGILVMSQLPEQMNKIVLSDGDGQSNE